MGSDTVVCGQLRTQLSLGERYSEGRKHMKLPFWKTSPRVSERESLLPRIKTVEMNRSLLERGIPSDQLPVTEPLVGDLVVSYALELPDMFEMVMPHHLARLGIALEELRPLAVENLRKKLTQIGVAKEGDSGLLYRVYTGNNLEACTLLAYSWWQDRAQELGLSIVAAAPNRDVVLFCNGESELAVRKLLVECFHYHAQETTHALSQQLYVWRGDGWGVYTRSAV